VSMRGVVIERYRLEFDVSSRAEQRHRRAARASVTGDARSFFRRKHDFATASGGLYRIVLVIRG
jgi:hypothetical protein